MKNSIAWKGATGATFTIEAEYTEKLMPDVRDLDGDKIEMDPKPFGTARLIIRKDGVQIDTVDNVNFWSCIEIGNATLAAKGITHRLWGSEKVGFGQEVAAQVDAMLKAVIAAGKTEDPEVVAYNATKTEAKADKERKNAEWVVAEAAKTPRNADGTLMNDREAAAWKRAYNNAMNDGAEGYVPDVITWGQYDAALKVLGNRSKP